MPSGRHGGGGTSSMPPGGIEEGPPPCNFMVIQSEKLQRLLLVHYRPGKVGHPKTDPIHYQSSSQKSGRRQVVVYKKKHLMTPPL